MPSRYVELYPFDSFAQLFIVPAPTASSLRRATGSGDALETREAGPSNDRLTGPRHRSDDAVGCSFMKTRDLAKIGIPAGRCADTAKQILQHAKARRSMPAVLTDLRRVAQSPGEYLQDTVYGQLARQLVDHAAAGRTFVPRMASAPFRIWGENLEDTAVQQLKNACKLPIAVSGALMPDAHVGYGLPIGGVLATMNAVIPYAVGVDIACRMKMTVLDLPVRDLEQKQDRLTRAIEAETRFGVGANFRDRRAHDVMDADWTVSPITKQHKDRAGSDLGTSGSGNHFVEFGFSTAHGKIDGLEPGT